MSLGSLLGREKSPWGKRGKEEEEEEKGREATQPYSKMPQDLCMHKCLISEPRTFPRGVHHSCLARTLQINEGKLKLRLN
jgi:hypothetical protein